MRLKNLCGGVFCLLLVLTAGATESVWVKGAADELYAHYGFAAEFEARIEVDIPCGIDVTWCEGTVPVSATESVTIKWKKSDGHPVPEVVLPSGWTCNRSAEP